MSNQQHRLRVVDVEPSGNRVPVKGVIRITFNNPVKMSEHGKIFLNDHEITEIRCFTHDGKAFIQPYSNLAHGTLYGLRFEGFRDIHDNIYLDRRDFFFHTVTKNSVSKR